MGGDLSTLAKSISSPPGEHPGGDEYRVWTDKTRLCVEKVGNRNDISMNKGLCRHQNRVFSRVREFRWLRFFCFFIFLLFLPFFSSVFTVLVQLVEARPTLATKRISQYTRGVDHGSHSLLFIGTTREWLWLVELVLRSWDRLRLSPAARRHLLDERDSAGRTALMHAAKHANADICVRLIHAGASVHLKARNGSTALHYATRGNSVDCVRHLLCPTIKIFGGDGRLHRYKGALLRFAMLKDRWSWARFIDLRCNKGLAALHFAVAHGNLSMVELLLNEGAWCNSPVLFDCSRVLARGLPSVTVHRCSSPLHIAAAYSSPAHMDCARAILEYLAERRIQHARTVEERQYGTHHNPQTTDGTPVLSGNDGTMTAAFSERGLNLGAGETTGSQRTIQGDHHSQEAAQTTRAGSDAAMSHGFREDQHHGDQQHRCRHAPSLLSSLSAVQRSHGSMSSSQDQTSTRRRRTPRHGPEVAAAMFAAAEANRPIFVNSPRIPIAQDEATTEGGSRSRRLDGVSSPTAVDGGVAPLEGGRRASTTSRFGNLGQSVEPAPCRVVDPCSNLHPFPREVTGEETATSGRLSPDHHHRQEEGDEERQQHPLERHTCGVSEERLQSRSPSHVIARIVLEESRGVGGGTFSPHRRAQSCTEDAQEIDLVPGDRRKESLGEVMSSAGTPPLPRGHGEHHQHHHRGAGLPVECHRAQSSRPSRRSRLGSVLSLSRNVVWTTDHTGDEEESCDHRSCVTTTGADVTSEGLCIRRGGVGGTRGGVEESTTVSTRTGDDGGGTPSGSRPTPVGGGGGEEEEEGMSVLVPARTSRGRFEAHFTFTSNTSDMRDPRYLPNSRGKKPMDVAAAAGSVAMAFFLDPQFALEIYAPHLRSEMTQGADRMVETALSDPEWFATMIAEKRSAIHDQIKALRDKRQQGIRSSSSSSSRKRRNCSTRRKSNREEAAEAGGGGKVPMTAMTTSVNLRRVAAITVAALMTDKGGGETNGVVKFQSDSICSTDSIEDPEVPCTICLQEEGDVMVDPCRHAMCASCALIYTERAMEAVQMVRPFRCPICRGDILGFLGGTNDDSDGDDDNGGGVDTTP